MNTQTSLVVDQIRIQQRADQIRDCQNRPSDIKIDAWCREHGITKTNYFYRLRRVREVFLCEYSLLLAVKKSKKCANMRLQT